MTPVQQDLLVSEYKALRSENLQRIDHLASQSRHILVITGAIWAWLLTEHVLLTRVAYWIPFVITALFWFNNQLTIKTIRRVSGYLRHVTETVELPNDLGWEKYLDTHPLGHMNRWGRIYWPFLLISNGLLPLYLLIFK